MAESPLPDANLRRDSASSLPIHIDDVKLALIVIVLIEFTIAMLCLYRPTYPTAQWTNRLVHVPSLIVGVNHMIDPPIPRAALAGDCILHKQTRKAAVVPVTYGTRLPDPRYAAYQRAKQTLFPNAWEYVHAGCTRYFATQAAVKYCQHCRTAEREWHASTSNPRPDE